MRIILVLIVVCSMVACQQKAEEKTTEKVVEPVKSYAVFGDTITTANVMAIANFTNSFTADSMQAKLETTANAVCKKKGCWMNVDLGNDQSMKVTFKDYGFFVPKDIEGKKVIFEGTAKKQITEVDVLKHYAEDAGKSQEEIDAITEPKEEIVFVATGVLIDTE